MALSQKSRDWLMALPAGALAFGLGPFLGGGRSAAVAMAIYVFYVVISQKWENRYDRSFWLAIAAFTVIHVAAIALIPFPQQIRPSLIVVPFGLADGLIMWAILNMLGKRSDRKKGKS